MNYKVLYRKYRPSKFSEIVGQTNIVNVLKKSIIQDRTAHAYIFTGIRGTGKTSMAKIFAKAVNCQNPIDGEACCECDSCLSIQDTPDIIEIDAASNNSVDNIRELIENTRLVPSFLKCKVYIIDEVHMLSSGAFNALLKTLEEPANHIKFILATTEIQKVPITILSRCQRFDFVKINEEEIANHILNICSQEDILINKESAQEISFLSDGSIRDALSILDQLSNDNKKITVEIIEENFGTLSNKKVKDFIEFINFGTLQEIHEKIVKFKNEGVDVIILITKMLHFYKDNILNNINNKANEFQKSKEIIITLSEKMNDIKNSYDPYLIFELSILDYILSWSDVSKNHLYYNEKAPNNSDTNELKPIENTDKQNEKIVIPIIENNYQETINDEIDKIRLNNCFSSASKEEKEINSKLWKNYIKQIQDSDLLIYSVIENSNIEASSDKIIVISTDLESTLLLLKKHRLQIEKTFNEMNDKNVKFSFITKKNWVVEKKLYINNHKLGIKYELIEEPEFEEEQIDVVANQAQEIFGADNVDLR